MRSLSCLTDNLFAEVRYIFSIQNKIPAQLFRTLWTVFNTPLVGALDIIDRNKVVRVTSSSGRVLYQINGKTGGVDYICLPTTDYCCCLAFRYSVLKHDNFPMCKHVLAARLADAMNKCEDKMWTDKQFSQALVSID